MTVGSKSGAIDRAIVFIAALVIGVAIKGVEGSQPVIKLGQVGRQANIQVSRAMDTARTIGYANPVGSVGIQLDIGKA